MKHVQPLVLVAVAALCLGAGALAGLSAQAKTHAGGKASGMLTFANTLSVGEQAALARILPDGSTDTFALPEGTVLVVTDVIASLNGPAGAGTTRGGLVSPSGIGGVHPYYSFDASQQSQTVIALTSGSVWSVMPEAVNAGDSATAVFLEVHGYLAKDK